MIASAFALFLFGTAVSAGPLMPSAPTEIIISKNRHPTVEKVTEFFPTRDNKSPFISNFVQTGTNVFFKPQFMLSASQMPAPVQKLVAAIEEHDCAPHAIAPVQIMPVMEEPLRIVEREFVAPPEVKEIIEINPMTMPVPVAMPKLPLVIEEPCEVEQVIIPKAPMVPMVIEVEESKAAVAIPAAPVLAPMELSKVPLMFEEVRPEAPVLVEVIEEHVKPIPEAPVLPPLSPMALPTPVLIEEPVQIEIKEEVVRPVVIPEAPVLRPLPVPAPVLIEEPVQIEIEREVMTPVVIPAAPVLAPMEMPVEIIEKHVKHVAIPEAPVLPPLAPIAIPTRVLVEEPVKIEIEKEVMTPVVIPAVPCDTVEIIEENVRPVAVPEAPVLSPLTFVKRPVAVEIEKEVIPAPLTTFVMPQAPVVVEKAAEVMLEPCEPAKEIIVERPMMPMPMEYSKFLSKPVVYPSAPEYLVPYSGFTSKAMNERLVIENSPMAFAPHGNEIFVERMPPVMGKTLLPTVHKTPLPYYTVV